MTHLRSFMKALKVKWIPHVVNGNNFLSVLFNDVVGEQMITMVWYLDKHSVKMLSKHIRHEFWRDVVKAWEDLLEEPTDVNILITKTTKVCKCVYTKFITSLQYKNKALDKWNTVLHQTLSQDDWIEHNTIVYQVTKNTKLQSFQFKIMQRILCTNRVLKMCKIKLEDARFAKFSQRQ